MVFPHTYRTEHSETHTTNANYGDYFRKKQIKKIKVQPALLKVLQHVDSSHHEFIEDLKEAVKLKSISGELKYKNEVIKMVKLVEKWMVKLNAKYECFYIGYQELDGKKVRLPPVILATILAGPGKKTVCIYANIDVKKPKTELWNTDPWDVVHKEKILYGNGLAVGKGALINWFHAIQAIKLNGELPINIKFIIEAMHYQNSEGLKDFLMTQKQVFLHTIDYVLVSDTEWIGAKYPCITYGCVGILHFDVFLTKGANSKMDIKEEMNKIFEKIALNDQVIIPDFDKNVTQITPDEEHLFEQIEFDVAEVRDKLPKEMHDWNKVKLLMHFWRQPTIYVDEIQTCICEKNDMSKIRRHFIIKIVPKQSNENCLTMVDHYIKRVVKELATGNTLEIKSFFDTRPWLEDCTSASYEAARRATVQIYKEDPSMIRSDNGFICINILQMIEKSILLLPLGNSESNGGGNNENMPMRNLFEGTKLLAAYLFQLALLAK